MNLEHLTYLEKKVLDDVIRPALSEEQPDHLYGRITRSQTLNFSALLEKLEDFYKHNGGIEWERVLSEKRTHELHQHHEIDQLQAHGIIGPKDGAKPRKVL